MKKIIFILSVILGTVALYAQSLNLGKRSEGPNKSALIETAKYVAMTYGSAYVPYFKDVSVSDVQVFRKEDYGDDFPEIRKQIGRKYYTVTFAYDTTSVRFAFDFAAKVRIWKNTREPLDVIFGNGMGRNFLFLSFKEQTNHSVKKRMKVAPGLIEEVPLQTEKEPENIMMDTLTLAEKEKVKELASRIPDSIRSHFAMLLNKWIFAIDHNPKTQYSASTHSYAELPEFKSLKSMGKEIIPLIMERLIDPSYFYLLVLYEAVQKDDNQKITYKNGDSHVLEDEQNRAVRCVKKWLEQ